MVLVCPKMCLSNSFGSDGCTGRICELALASRLTYWQQASHDACLVLPFHPSSQPAD